MTSVPLKPRPEPEEGEILFSVVIPAYNVAPYIGHTLQSVLNQTLQNFEIIVIDDGSTDDTSEQVRSLGDPRIQLIRKQNEGVSVARNLGIERASGVWVAFLDGDDVWMPRHLELCKQCLDHYPEAAWATSRYVKTPHVDPNGGMPQPDAQEKGFKLYHFFSYFHYDPNFVWTSATVIRKSALRGLHLFPEGISHGEDTLAWILLAARHPRIGMIETPTVYYRQREGSAMAAVHGNDLRLLELTARMLNYLASAVGKENYSDEARAFYRLYMMNEWSLMLRLFSLRGYSPLLKKCRPLLKTPSWLVLSSFILVQEMVRKFFYILFRVTDKIQR